MSQRIRFIIAMLFVPIFGAASFGADTKVVISVEKPKSGDETADHHLKENARLSTWQFFWTHRIPWMA